MNPLSILLPTIVVMGLITLFLRAFPTIVPKRLLKSPWLIALNFALPMAVMTILILGSLNLFNVGDVSWIKVISELLAIILVLISYILWKNVLISLVVGISSLNGFIYLLNAF